MCLAVVEGRLIARQTRWSVAPVSRVLRRSHLSRWRDLSQPHAVVRYEHPHPGDLLHLDIKGVTRFGKVVVRGDVRLLASESSLARVPCMSPWTITPG